MSRMAGLYIHVPFCQKRCLYCDFYSNTNMSYKESYLKALLQEMELRKDYIEGEILETIYLGGGTPSQLSIKDLSEIFDAIYKNYSVASDMEITMEANPDDMSAEYVSSLRSLPVNRISMGVQSFAQEDLTFLNRRHDREEAIQAVRYCKENGFNNISLDLIYGLPGQTPEKWKRNLDEIISLDIPHISAYHLIYEEGTALYKLWEAGKIKQIDEDVSLDLFMILIDRLRSEGYEHYEISNFALPGKYSRHNSSYWLGKKYLGLGPSAHSYDGKEREWNVASLPDWIKGIKERKPDVEREILDLDTRYNDYIVTRLRTMWGIDLDEVLLLYGKEKLNYCLKISERYIKDKLLIQKDRKLTLSKDGIFISDGIMSDLLWT